ncbi:MAG TPA: DUF2922 domain-containing protein [Clostridia bacterium]|nr:DUF2922 domain-containing protein [Clostridia bacterium]
MQSRRLEMIFQNAGGSRVTVAVVDPRNDLTEQEVEEAMNAILSNNIFDSAGGDLTGLIGARIVTRDVVELNIV